jgi:hypothetical protein
MFAHRLALRLSLSLGDVWAMPAEDWTAWSAYFELEAAENAKP